MEKNLSTENQGEEDDIVNPWEVASHSAKGVDYDKLISKIYLTSSNFDVYFCILNI